MADWREVGKMFWFSLSSAATSPARTAFCQVKTASRRLAFAFQIPRSLFDDHQAPSPIFGRAPFAPKACAAEVNKKNGSDANKTNSFVLQTSLRV
jgi:hypothetical protein